MKEAAAVAAAAEQKEKQEREQLQREKQLAQIEAQNIRDSNISPKPNTRANNQNLTNANQNIDPNLLNSHDLNNQDFEYTNTRNNRGTYRKPGGKGGKPPRGRKRKKQDDPNRPLEDFGLSEQYNEFKLLVEEHRKNNPLHF